MSFGNFLKNIDSTLHSQYLLERYSEGKSLTSNTKSVITFEAPVFKSTEERLIDSLLSRLDTLPEDNEAVLFCKERLIPPFKFDKLYYIENIKDIVQLNDKYKESIRGTEPRLVIPFYDEKDQLTGVTCRALRGEALRYITVRVKENVPLIFGLSHVNKNKTTFVVEGPIDSLFIENGIAVAGTSFDKVDILSISSDKLVYIYDNQPRNVEVCKLIERAIDQNRNVVIWPQNIAEKDINEMVIAGKNVQKIISENIFTGLTAKAKFYSWKRV